MGARPSLGGSAAFLLCCATCVKLLLVPGYRSSDFEVHRNWLAITHSLPLSKWYVDETSPWTLDYPPFFAWFERLLSIFAHRMDPTMTSVKDGIGHASLATVLFQRASVMVSDVLLVVAAFRYCRALESDPAWAGAEAKDSYPPKGLGPGAAGRGAAVWVLGAVVLLPGLLVVDHIHFQYNGLLLGLLVLSVAFLREGKDWAAGLVFAVLCCMKHLFAVAGPWYAVFLFRAHCMAPPVTPLRVLSRTAALGLTVGLVLALAFGPFVAMGQMGQVVSRLFPFGRGLSHAYWAPNAWALYNTADMLLVRAASHLPLPPHLAAAVAAATHKGRGSFTRGLVGHGSGSHVLLPSVTPGVSLLLVLLSMLPCLVSVWRHPLWHRRHAATSLAYIFLGAFLFGWHVHEKAALHFALLLALAAADSRANCRDYLYLSAVVNYSLFPLLFGYAEYPIKVLLLLLYLGGLSATSWGCFPRRKDATGAGARSSLPGSVWSYFCKVHMAGVIVVELYVQALHPVLLGDRFSFLPLMLISVYCAVGITTFYLVTSFSLPITGPS